MSLKIRLARAGTTKRPFYHVVIADARSPRDGRFIEKIGTYDPKLAEQEKRVNIVAEPPSAPKPAPRRPPTPRLRPPSKAMAFGPHMQG